MRKTLFKSGIIIIWLVMTWWFVRYEAFPHFFTHSSRGYEDLFSNGVLVSDSWMKILFNGKPIGYTHMSVDSDERSISARYRMENETVLNINLMGTQAKITTSVEAVLDAMYRLQRFSFDVYTGTSQTRIRGRRISGETFNVKIDTGGAAQFVSVTIPDDTIVYSPATDQMLAELKPGEETALKAFDPVSMRTANVVIRALSKEKIVFNGREIEAKLVSADYLGVTARSWIGPDGKVLRQEIPPGFIAETCDAREAMSAGLGAAEADDMLKTLSVKLAGTIADPENCTELKLRVSGIALKDCDIETERQAVQPGEGDAFDLTVSKAELPDAGIPVGAAPAGIKPFLESSPYIQADNPEMAAQAASIVGGRTNSMDAAMAIFEWVDREIAPQQAPGIPSALEVLHNRSGDCNEHTYIFVALARAAGLPAKVKVGIVYVKDGFYYHAWPSVYVGRWVEMDPTFGQPGVDATHIALLEGEIADQMRLMQIVGRLKAELVSQKY